MNRIKDRHLLKTYRELTDYPDIYYSYWGQFREYKEKNEPKPIIIENRNKFAKEYELVIHKRDWVKRPSWINMYLANIPDADHIEAYKNKNGEYVIIFSGHIPITDLYGFKEIYPLYDTSQTTYCITLPPTKKKLLEKATVEINGQAVNISVFNQT